MERNRVSHCAGAIHQFKVNEPGRGGGSNQSGGGAKSSGGGPNHRAFDGIFDEVVLQLDGLGLLLWHSKAMRRLIVKDAPNRALREHIKAVIQTAMNRSHSNSMSNSR